MTKFLAWLTAHGINLASAVALIHMFPNNKYLAIINVILGIFMKTPQKALAESDESK